MRRSWSTGNKKKALDNKRHSIPLQIVTKIVSYAANSKQKHTKSKQKQLAYRDKFIKAQIETRPMIAGNMASQPFYKKYVKKNQSLPNAQFLHKNSFYCGNNPELTKQDLERIIEVTS